jgi:V/A-type H+-transporting ATPase subunit E
MKMQELQPLLDSILEDARKEAAEIRKKGRAEAEELRAEYMEKAERLREEIMNRGEKQAADEKNRRKIQAKMDAGRELLAAKNQLVEEVFQTVKKRLARMKDEDYRQLLRHLILQAVETGDEKLFFSIPDRRWLGEAFLADLNQELEKRGRKGALTYGEGEAAADLSGGFILQRGKVVQNFSLDNLVEMKKDELLPEVGRRLFSEPEETEA